MKKLFLIIVVFFEGCSFLSSSYQESEKEYWNLFYQNNNKIILNQNEIKKFNQLMLEANKVLIDFKKLPIYIEKNKNKKFGIAILKGNVRAKPTDTPEFEDENDTHFDMVQYKELKFGEPIILLKSKGEWDLVATYNVQGWVKRKNIAFFTSYKEFLKYVYDKNIVVVTEKNIELKKQTLDMGVRLGLLEENKKYVTVKFPVKDYKDDVYFVKTNIAKSKIHVGFLSYTKHNFVKQVLKYLGTPYGWGGLYNGIDCSGLVLNVYSVFGFEFPRNSFQQQNVAKKAIVITNRTQLKKELNNKKTGGLLFFPGHIMIYLGNKDNENYIIHSVASYSDDGEKEEIMKVIISDLNLIRKTGKPYKDEIASFTFIGK